MAASSLVGDMLKSQEKNGKLIAAICASPAMVLKTHEIGTLCKNNKQTPSDLQIFFSRFWQEDYLLSFIQRRIG